MLCGIYGTSNLKERYSLTPATRVNESLYQQLFFGFMSRRYLLAATSWKTVQQIPYGVAILPWGATEAHGYHLPYSTDNVQVEYIATEAARRAYEQGAYVVVLPCVPFGVQTGQRDIQLCINMNPSTQAAVLQDVAESLDVQGIHKLLILNGHGGNDFRQIIRELQPKTRVLLCTANWYQLADRTEYFTEPGDHADELETSVMMYIAPALVRPLEEAGEGNTKRHRIRAMREGKVWMPRPWRIVSHDTGVGSPHAASPEKGKAFVEAVVSYLAQFLVEFAAADAANLYE
ncbi:MAG: creatininase family protein [Bacteroidota bacterium]|nr:creatininase family protein [Candidatus Kapabacteria bacterium]MDW8218913.1 creatininase family protein [Bacteroidota bacterium]